MADYMCPADPTVTHCYHAAKVNELIAERDDEIKRLRAGGCARDQGLTQYCAEAVEKDAEIARLKAEVERLRVALEEIASGKYSGIVLTSFPPQDPAVNRARAALTPSQEPRT